MDGEDVRQWMVKSETAWREQKSSAVAELFTENAEYLDSPYEIPRVGHDAIAAEWNDPRPFEMAIKSITVDAPQAVVRVKVNYSDPDQEHAYLWGLDFDTAGKVERLVEGAGWPGKGFTAQREQCSGRAEGVRNAGRLISQGAHPVAKINSQMPTAPLHPVGPQVLPLCARSSAP